MKRLLALVAAACAVAVAPAEAQQQDAQAVVDSLYFQQGTIPLGSNLATLRLTPAFRYLSPADTKKVLVDLWGNPPEAVGETMGSIVPADVGVLDEDGWLIIVSYEDSGHVGDEDAASIDYAALLADMQQATREDSEERVKQGHEKLELVGWAEPPHYDSQAKKIYWAKHLKFGDAPPPDTLNYNIRVLGRTGFLDLTAVASMTQLPMINSRVNEILGTVTFNAGNRYADFDASSDHVAEYGIAGLIAGGVLAKAGFFKVLAAFGKWIVLGLAIAGGGLFNFFRRRKSAGG
ncbi:MAG TPA: DUF2167 domain-containing protein [Dongiaceae bacterium]